VREFVADLRLYPSKHTKTQLFTNILCKFSPAHPRGNSTHTISVRLGEAHLRPRCFFTSLYASPVINSYVHA